MTPAQHQRIKDLFDEAFDLPPAAQTRWLAHACSDDAAVRAEVERLLHSQAAQPEFLEAQSAAELLGVQAVTMPLLTPGRQLGAFRLLRELGQGGGGTVWLAERDDGTYTQQVAIKLVWPGFGSEALLRFKQEREILARLDHPHIARLLDGGATAEGWHYLVMEYVEGQPLTTYCRTQQLTIPARLALFRAICAAVQYAHQNLIIHRDLKPSNIMVTASIDGKGGTPKLLDFGIAKLLERSAQDMTLTGTGQQPFTPLYASPEQIRNEPITTASDVYSLGVLLYELLTGVRPYGAEATTPPEQMRAVCEDDPPRPSAVIVERLKKDEGERIKGVPVPLQPAALRGDLDNIVLKALRKEAAQRYPTVEQLSDDLQRHLNGEPVTARPATWRYRAGKYVGRNKPFVAAASTLLLALIVGALVTFWQLRASQARERAQRRELYAADMRQAGQELNEGNLARVRELIAKHQPTAEAEAGDDWRGFEWYLLWHAAHAGQTLLRHPGYDFNGDLAPDGQRLFVRSRDGKIATYDLGTRHLKELFSDQQDWIADLDVSRDGKRLAAGGRTTGVARVWDIATRRLLSEIKAHDRSVNTVALSPDGKLLATGSIEATAKVWDVATGRLLHFEQRENWVRDVAFSPDGKVLAIANAKSLYPLGQLTLLETGSFRQLGALELSSALQQFAFSPDGTLLAGAPRDGIVRLWEVKSLKLLREFAAHNDIVWSVAFSPDGKLLASRGNDSKLRLWELSTGASFIKSFSDAEIASIAFLPSQVPDYIIATSEFGGTTLWDVDKLGQSSTVNQSPSEINAVAVAPDGRLIASTGGSRTRVWQLPELKESGAYQKNISHYCVLFSSDGRWLLTAGGKAGLGAETTTFVDLRDLATGALVNSWGGHRGQVSGAAFSPDGQWLVTAGDQTVKLWDVPSGRERLTINAHEFLALAVDVSPDGRRLVSGGYDALAKVWDAANGRELFRLSGHTYPVNTVKFSPDGKLIATGSSDHLVKLWDAATGRELRTLIGHARDVTGVAFTPDGKRLASASEDRTLRIWEVETGVELLTLKGHKDFVTSLAFSPDGQLLITGGRDQTVRLWRAATAAEVQARP